MSLPASSVNITTGSPANTFNAAAHGLANIVRVTTTGTLPAPLVVRTDYYVVGVTANTFQLSATFNGAAIPITTIGVGTHTFTVTGSTIDTTGGYGAKSNYYYTTPASFTVPWALESPSGAVNVAGAYDAMNNGGDGGLGMVRIDAATLSPFINRGTILGYGVNPISGTLTINNVISAVQPDTGVTNWIAAGAVMPDYRTLTIPAGSVAMTGKVDVYIQGAMSKTDGTVDTNNVSGTLFSTKVATDSNLAVPGLPNNLPGAGDVIDGYRYFRLIFKMKGPPTAVLPTWGTVDGISVPYFIQ